MLGRLLFIGAISFLGFYAITTLVPSERYVDTPLLTDAYKKSDLPERLKDLSVEYFEVACSGWSKKTQATFYFVDKEHRPALKVKGSHSCEQSGALFGGSLKDIDAKENYKPELVFAEINDLLAKSNLQKNTGNRFNSELAQQFQKQYSELAQKRQVGSVFFHCEEPGEPYSYVYYQNGGRHKISETLKTACKVAHQNFDVDMESDPAAVRFTVHEYNAVDAATVTAVYGEFLGVGPTKNMF
jgi:hypothetical protein